MPDLLKLSVVSQIHVLFW